MHLHLGAERADPLGYRGEVVGHNGQGSMAANCLNLIRAPQSAREMAWERAGHRHALCPWHWAQARLSLFPTPDVGTGRLSHA